MSGPELMLLGTLSSQVLGGAVTAESNKQASKIQQQELEQTAAEERAVAGRKQIEQRKETERVQSRLRAAAAKSGGGVTGTVLDLAADIGARGKFNEEMIGYQGESRARGLESKSAAVGYKAKADYLGTYLETGAKAAKTAYGAYK